MVRKARSWRLFIKKLCGSALFAVAFLCVVHAIIGNSGEAMSVAASSEVVMSAPVAQSQKADLVIFSFDRPLQLYALLESIQKHMCGIEAQRVIYRASNQQYADAYAQVATAFPDVVCVAQGSNPRDDFKPLTLEATFKTPSRYVIFAVDDIVVRGNVNLTQCIDLLEKHQSYGFFLRLGKNLDYCYSCNAPQPLPALQEMGENLYAWQFLRGSYDWQYPHTVDMTLYRKEDIRHAFETMQYHNPNQLEAQWAGRAGAIIQRNGLCFGETKIVNLPLNRVQHEYQNRHTDALLPAELLAIWNQGQKLDIVPLEMIVNKSAHMDYEPTFIKRGAVGYGTI